MLLDHSISKPASVQGYDVHRMVSGLTKDEKTLFADLGERILIRCESPITSDGAPLRHVDRGDVIGFELRACVSKKNNGKHVYFPEADWRRRHEWLRQKGTKHGFSPLTLHCKASRAKLDNGRGNIFTVDQTDFVGVLRVTDKELFENVLAKGIGSTAKTYGFGMLII